MKPDSLWLARHVHRLRASYRHWTGRDLLSPDLDPHAAIAALDAADFAVVSHGIQNDPVFNYGNRTALALFEMTWAEFTVLPSRLSAEPMQQIDRDRLLQQVTLRGYIDDYTGVRISKHGNRLLIRNATVWNILNETGAYAGQAALLREWEPLTP